MQIGKPQSCQVNMIDGLDFEFMVECGCNFSKHMP